MYTSRQENRTMSFFPIRPLVGRQWHAGYIRKEKKVRQKKGGYFLHFKSSQRPQGPLLSE